jgi:hypothetical protein
MDFAYSNYFFLLISFYNNSRFYSSKDYLLPLRKGSSIYEELLIIIPLVGIMGI